MNTHPEYDQRVDDWRKYRLSYNGGDEYLQTYLYEHEKERDKYYQQRLQRAFYPNHCRAIVDTYAAHLFRENIPRSTEEDSETLQRFWANIDLKGNGADSFYEHAAQKVQYGGRVAVVCDRWDPDGGGAVTRAQERQSGRRPYAYLVDTEDIVDWDVNRLGQLNWVAIREPIDVERNWDEPHPGVDHQYRVWTDEEWILLREVEAEDDEDEDTRLVVVDRGAHPVGEPPVTMIYWGFREGIQPVADSALKDLAPMNIRLTNLTSLIDEQIYAHVFNILATPKSTYDELEGVDWSVSGAIPYDDDVSNPPHYIGPDVEKLEAIRAEVKKTEDQIRQLAGLGRVNEETKHAQSGIALSYLTMDKDALLAKFGQRMRRAEAQVDRYALAWMEESPDVGQSREYPEEFDPVDVQNELSDAIKFASLEIPRGSEAAAENIIEAARVRFGGRLDAEELESLEEDLRSRLEDAASGNERPAPSLQGVG